MLSSDATGAGALPARLCSRRDQPAAWGRTERVAVRGADLVDVHARPSRRRRQGSQDAVGGQVHRHHIQGLRQRGAQQLGHDTSQQAAHSMLQHSNVSLLKEWALCSRPRAASMYCSHRWWQLGIELFTTEPVAGKPSIAPRPSANTSGSMQAMLSMMPLQHCAPPQPAQHVDMMMQLLHIQQRLMSNGSAWHDGHGHSPEERQTGLRRGLPHSRLHDRRSEQHKRHPVFVRRRGACQLCKRLGVRVAVVPAEPDERNMCGVTYPAPPR